MQDAVARAEYRDSTAPIVEFRDVSRSFNGSKAVDGVSLQVRQGEFLTLLGPSGCGKTTMLRLMAGFEQPDVGDVFINQKSVGGVPPYRRDVGMVFQNYALFPHLNVSGNVAFGLELREGLNNWRTSAI